MLPLTEFQPFLLLDMAPCRLSPVTAGKALSLGFFFGPHKRADVAVFGGYKAHLVKRLLQNESLAGKSVCKHGQSVGNVCREYWYGEGLANGLLEALVLGASTNGPASTKSEKR